MRWLALLGAALAFTAVALPTASVVATKASAQAVDGQNVAGPSASPRIKPAFGYRTPEAAARARHRLRHHAAATPRAKRRIGSGYVAPLPRPAATAPGMPGPQVYTPPSMQPAPQYYTTPGHMQYCSTRYRTYDPSTNTVPDSRGVPRPCQ
jgi:hypothetical protein